MEYSGRPGKESSSACIRRYPSSACVRTFLLGSACFCTLRFLQPFEGGLLKKKYMFTQRQTNAYSTSSDASTSSPEGFFLDPGADRGSSDVTRQNVTIANESYLIPSATDSRDAEFMSSWNGSGTPGEDVHVKYMRSFEELALLTGTANCAPAVQVLERLMAEAISSKSTFVLAYGELLHAFREKDLINPTTGNNWDDDIDVWALTGAITQILSHEKYLFDSFGWTARIFINDHRVVFIQLLAACGHTPISQTGKVLSQEPAIEIYPLVQVVENGERLYKDLWQNTRFVTSLMFPVKLSSVNLTGYPQEFHFQVPNRALAILDCLYEDWNVVSWKHASLGKRCLA